MNSTKRPFGGLILIFIGILFLLNNFGLLGWDVWFSFIQFWPIILIAVGLKLIFRNNLIVQIIALMLVFLVPLVYYLGYGNKYLPPLLSESHNYQEHNWSLDNEGKVSKASIKMQIGAGKISVLPTDKLISLESATRGPRPKIKADHNNDEAEISISQSGNTIPIGIGVNKGADKWELGLGRNILWALDISTGAVKGELDLRGISFSRLSIDTGAGDIRVVLGEIMGESEIDIDSGAGNITIVIPGQVGVLAEIDTGIGSKNLPDRNWQQSGNVYTSDNYNDAQGKVRVNIEAGAGTVSLLMP